MNSVGSLGIYKDQVNVIASYLPGVGIEYQVLKNSRIAKDIWGV